MRRVEWLLVALLTLAFAPAGVAMARVWVSFDYYSHGFLVPLVAVWVAREKAAVRDWPLVRDPRGGALIAIALAIYVLGLLAGEVTLQGIALVTAVAGAVCYLWGGAGLRTLAFPTGLLVFMVPIPPSWLNPLILDLQLLVSVAAVGVARAFGVAVVREGNVLVLPAGQSLFVAEACSGITSIVTLTPLALVLAYFTSRRLRTRGTIVACVIPAAMLGNLLRVVVTLLAADAVGVERATGNPLHEFAGLLTFLLACGLLVALSAALRERPRPA